MEKKKRYCLSLWGRSSVMIESWSRWVDAVVDDYFWNTTEALYIDVDAPGFSDKVSEFSGPDQQARLKKRMAKAAAVESVGLYSVPDGFSAVSTGYSMSAVRTAETASLVVTGDGFEEVWGDPAHVVEKLAMHIRWERAELFCTSASDEPWFYVMGDNEVEDIDDFESIRVWDSADV